MPAGFKTRETLAILVCGLALASIAVLPWRGRPGLDKSLHAQIGRNLAAECKKLLGPGGKVTIITRDLEAYPQPAMAIVLAVLQKELPAIRSVESIQRDPIRPNEAPPGDFFELLRRLPAGDVILSLLGPPVLMDDQRARLGRPKAKVVALCIGQSGHLSELFRAGLLHSALVSKPAGGAGGRSFDQLYAIAHGAAL